MGEVTKIFLCKVKKEPRIEVEAGKFLEDFGLEGDAYSATGASKQLTIFFDEGRDALSEEPFSGLCFPRFLETIRIRRIKADNLKTGTKIQVGKAVFAVSKPRKKCYPECSIIQDGRHCALSSDVRFCTVLQAGTIQKGDSVAIIDEY